MLIVYLVCLRDMLVMSVTSYFAISVRWEVVLQISLFSISGERGSNMCTDYIAIKGAKIRTRIARKMVFLIDYWSLH